MAENLNFALHNEIICDPSDVAILYANRPSDRRTTVHKTMCVSLANKKPNNSRKTFTKPSGEK